MATLPRLKPRALLRPRRRSRDHPAGPDRRADGASVSEAAAGRGAGRRIRIRRSSRSSRARSACRCSRSSCCGWRWSRPASPAGRRRSCGARWASSDPRSGCSRSKCKLREGMARQGITGDAAEEIIRSITSFALYGFPESHAASFALLAYASAYLKAHYPAAFYTALLNNQPMGFYHPATLVKDAQRRGVRFAPIDVQDLGLGLPRRAGRPRPARADVRERPAAGSRACDCAPVRQDRGCGMRPMRDAGHRRTEASQPKRCPKCGCDDESMLEETPRRRMVLQHLRARLGTSEYAMPSAGQMRRADRRSCGPTARDIARSTRSSPHRRAPRRTGDARRHRRAERLRLSTRRTALWQVERAVRPSGELFEERPRPPTATGLEPTSKADRDRGLPTAELAEPADPDPDRRLSPSSEAR